MHKWKSHEWNVWQITDNKLEAFGVTKKFELIVRISRNLSTYETGSLIESLRYSKGPLWMAVWKKGSLSEENPRHFIVFHISFDFPAYQSQKILFFLSSSKQEFHSRILIKSCRILFFACQIELFLSNGRP